MSKNKISMHDFSEVVNPKLRPQDDFYKYVNDKWLSNNSIPPEESHWSNFMQLHESTLDNLHQIIKDLNNKSDVEPGSIEQKVRDFYVAGLSQDKSEASATAHIKSWMDEIDRCSMSGLPKLLASLHVIGVSPLFSLYIDQDEADSTSYLLRFHQSGLSLPTKDYYLDDGENMDKIRQGLVAHIETMFEASGAAIDENRAKDIFSLEYELANRSVSQADLRNVDLNYNKMSYESFSGLMPSFNWDSYFQQLDIDPPKNMSADQPDFMQHVDEILKSKNIDTLRNYLKWHLIIGLVRFSSDDLAEKNFKFFGTQLNGIPSMKPRWKRVLSNLDDALGEALGQLYVERHFPQVAKERMQVLTTDLKQAFAARIENIDWMQPETKKSALEKLEAIEVNVGYPDEWRSFDGLDITPDSYIGNYCEAAWFEAKRQLSKLGKAVDRKEWYMSPQTVNAYYSPNMNSITFPAGILQTPLFDYEADDAINYGGIGVVIGHELTHGFDDMGAQFDKRGNFKNWWSQEDRQAFEARTEVVSKQGYEHEAHGQKMDGRLTMGESIADIGGLTIAYEALQLARQRSDEQDSVDGYSADERFFFNFARIWREHARKEAAIRSLISDEHPPNDYRVNNTLRNVDVFYEVFDVQPGDALYLPANKRADIW